MPHHEDAVPAVSLLVHLLESFAGPSTYLLAGLSPDFREVLLHKAVHKGTPIPFVGFTVQLPEIKLCQIIHLLDREIEALDEALRRGNRTRQGRAIAGSKLDFVERLSGFIENRIGLRGKL